MSTQVGPGPTDVYLSRYTPIGIGDTVLVYFGAGKVGPGVVCEIAQVSTKPTLYSVLLCGITPRMIYCEEGDEYLDIRPKGYWRMSTMPGVRKALLGPDGNPYKDA